MSEIKERYKDAVYVCPKCGEVYARKPPSCGNKRTDCYARGIQVISIAEFEALKSTNGGKV